MRKGGRIIKDPFDLTLSIFFQNFFHINKKRELIQENNATADDSSRRLRTAVEKLEGLVSDSKDELSDTKEYQEAVEYLELAKSVL